MEDIYVRREGKADEPHRHNYYTVLIVHKADGVHKVDFSVYPLQDNQIFFVAPGQVHQVIEYSKSIGFGMTFSTEFLVKNSIPLSFIEGLALFNNYGDSPPLEPSTLQLDEILDLSEKIYSLHYGESNMKNLAIGSYLKLMLIACNNICSLNPVQDDNKGSSSSTLRAFRDLVDDKYREEHSTSYFANRLNITPDHLNRIIKNSIGKTAKEYIQSRIVTEAKRLLYFSDLNNKEIGYELGFNEPANFSAFFKKCTSQSPTEFKKSQQKS